MMGVIAAGPAGVNAEESSMPDTPHFEDRFLDLSPWRLDASDDVKASLHGGTAGQSDGEMCLDFDFGKVSGYVTARRDLDIRYGKNYEFTVDVRGDAPPNGLQLKVADAGAVNVWWINRPDYVFTPQWQTLRVPQRDLSFAWGTAVDRTLTRSTSLELVVARGRGGGKGRVCFRRLTFRELPDAAPAAPPEPPSPNAFFQDVAKRAPRGRYPRSFSGEQSYWTVVGIDGGSVQGLLSEDGALEPGPGLPAVEPFLLEGSSPVGWADVRIDHSLEDGYLPLPTVTWRRDAWSASMTAFGWTQGGAAPGEAKRRDARHGDGGHGDAGRGDAGHGDAGHGDAGRGDAEHGDPRNGDAPHGQLIVDYAVRNASERPLDIALALAVRPFQVNPPTQFLNTQGGVAPIRHLAWDGRVLTINGEQRMLPLQAPDEVRLIGFHSATGTDVMAALSNSVSAARSSGAPADTGSAPRELDDPAGFASAVLLYRLRVPAHGEMHIGLVTPLAGEPRLPAADAEGWLQQRRRETAAAWRAKLNHVGLELPAEARPLVQTLRSALAQILLDRAGVALQPGTRAYARTWVRDGAMIADALHRLGQDTVARRFIDWFAPHQFSSGKVPCCVDWRGADPVVENDSPGEFIHMIAAQYRYDRDRAWLQRMWPHAAAAVAYMDRLRAGERTPANTTADRLAYYGLLPPSISHEGYSDHPAYSYWDDFWGIAGYTSALDIAAALDRDDAGRIAAAREEFMHDVGASLARAMAARGLAYLPASADRGDFDPTSTTIALSVAGVQEQLPQPALHETYERYWNAFVERRDGRRPWEDYTPYELRNVGAFIRLGWRRRARELLEFFMGDRRPQEWNQWAEVVGRDPRKPRFIGDMPHGWVASDFIQCVLDMFAYEQDGALQLAAGVPPEWLTGRGIAVRQLGTPYGPLSYVLRRDGTRLSLELEAGKTAPPRGFLFRWPYETAPGRARVDGRDVAWRGGALAIPAGALHVEIEAGSGG